MQASLAEWQAQVGAREASVAARERDQAVMPTSWHRQAAAGAAEPAIADRRATS